MRQDFRELVCTDTGFMQTTIVTIALLSASLFFSIWVLLTKALSFNNQLGIIVMETLWCSYLVILWVQCLHHAKSIIVSNNSLTIILNNGEEIKIPKERIQEIQVKKYMGYTEFILKSLDERKVKFTNRLSNYMDLLKYLPTLQAEEGGRGEDKLTRNIKFYFILSLLIIGISLLLATSYDFKNANLLYIGSCLIFVFWVIVGWLFYKIKK